jgi:hypothetical protein
MPVQAPYAIATGQAGQDRGQIQFYSLDSLIEADNEVRAIEALVDKVPLCFKVKGKSRDAALVWVFSAKWCTWRALSEQKWAGIVVLGGAAGWRWQV